WDALFLDHRDHANLVPLPLSLRAIFFANLSAILALAALFTIVVNAASLVLFPIAVVGSKFLRRVDSLYSRPRRGRLHRQRLQLLCRLCSRRKLDGPSPCRALAPSLSRRSLPRRHRPPRAHRQQLHGALSAHASP